MNLSKLSLRVVAAAAAVLAFHGMASAASFSALSAGGNIASVTGFTTETTSIPNNFLMPQAPAGSTISSYSVLSTNPGFSSTGTLTFGQSVTSYTFLWGSPDGFNLVTDNAAINAISVTGSSFSTGTGNNSESQLYTFADARGFSSLTFSTSGVAFEVAAVTPVPEPETYALMLGGLGVMAMLARRRRPA